MEQKSDGIVVTGLGEEFFIDPSSPRMNSWERGKTLSGLEVALQGYIESNGGNIPDEVFDRMVGVADSFGQRFASPGFGDPKLTGQTTDEWLSSSKKRAVRESDDPERALIKEQLNVFLSNPAVIKDPRAQAVLERIATFREAQPLTNRQMYTKVVESQRTSDGGWRQTLGPKPGITREEHLPVFERYLAEVKYTGIYPNLPGAFIDSAKEAVTVLKR